MSELRLKSTGTIKLFENDNTSNITIASPASLGADRTITLPDASVTLASGTMLATDGDGSSLTGLTAGQIPNLAASKITSGTIDTARLGSGTASSSTVLYGDQTYKAEPGGGKLLQAVMANTTGSTTTTGISYVTTDLTASITPASSSNKVLVLVSLGFAMVATSTLAYPQFSLRRDTDTELAYKKLTISAAGATSVQAGEQTVFTYLDSPSTTSAMPYRVDMKNHSSYGGTIYINDGAKSSIVLLEIEG